MRRQLVQIVFSDLRQGPLMLCLFFHVGPYVLPKVREGWLMLCLKPFCASPSRPLTPPSSPSPNTHTHTHLHEHPHSLTQTHTHTHTHAYTYVLTCSHSEIDHTHTYINSRMHTNKSTNTQTHTHTQTNTHTYTLTDAPTHIKHRHNKHRTAPKHVRPVFPCARMPPHAQRTHPHTSPRPLFFPNLAPPLIIWSDTNKPERQAQYTTPCMHVPSQLAVPSQS